jgi:hypothetical protein
LPAPSHPCSASQPLRTTDFGATPAVLDGVARSRSVTPSVTRRSVTNSCGWP